MTNKKMVLISGESTTGKSLSLRNLRNPERVLYLNCEAGKDLPFKNRFDSKIIVDPYQVLQAFDYINPGGKGNANYDTVVIDTLTFLMDMFESNYVLKSANTMAGWSNYQQFFKDLMQQKVATSDKNVIILAHTRSELDESISEMRTSVPIKGALKNQGIEAYFSTVVSTKRVDINKHLQNVDPALIQITDEEEALGYKYVFQTRLTKETKNERIRSPFGMFAPNQTYMDNDAQLLLDYLNQYYN